MRNKQDTNDLNIYIFICSMDGYFLPLFLAYAIHFDGDKMYIHFKKSYLHVFVIDIRCFLLISGANIHEYRGFIHSIL